MRLQPARRALQSSSSLAHTPQQRLPRYLQNTFLGGKKPLFQYECRILFRATHPKFQAQPNRKVMLSTHRLVPGIGLSILETTHLSVEVPPIRTQTSYVLLKNLTSQTLYLRPYRRKSSRCGFFLFGNHPCTRRNNEHEKNSTKNIALLCLLSVYPAGRFKLWLFSALLRGK